ERMDGIQPDREQLVVVGDQAGAGDVEVAGDVDVADVVVAMGADGHGGHVARRKRSGQRAGGGGDGDVMGGEAAQAVAECVEAAVLDVDIVDADVSAAGCQRDRAVRRAQVIGRDRAGGNAAGAGKRVVDGQRAAAGVGRGDVDVAA